jgi:hypothetical protein
MSYWITFVEPITHNGRSYRAGCVNMPEDAEAFGPVQRCEPLPYPADPQLTTRGWPSFCYDPTTCQGRHACPKGHACSE